MSQFLILGLAATALGYPAVNKHHHTPLENATDYLVSVGPRPYYIISNMTDSPLKRKLQSCENTPVSISPFTIGHRGGGTLQFPEESIRSQDAVSTLCSKQDGFNASATTPLTYQAGTPLWRTELYDTCAQTLTLNQYIDLVDSYPGYRNFTPELKTPPAAVPMPFQGNYTQAQYASDMISAFRLKGISADRVWPQSFLFEDVVYWIDNDEEFGAQAVYLQEFDTPSDLAAGFANLSDARAAGVNIIAPSLPMLLSIGGADNNTIVESEYAKAIKDNGMDIIAWTFERSGPLANVKRDGEYYFASIADVVDHDGQYYEVLDVLVREVGVKGLFTDWAGTSFAYTMTYDKMVCERT
ncbi:uncharacterized protein J4E84_009267 [Alternaria hordeiaustralica]|uniref:uncharacterized protein n=1 Tax=Alternaria hordeiaustralica TaxID=1187925 RepID=UPI0020C4432E|nr:uncharacterized protein J4E84_009267 [Alternaria hordeiaustralica]KAI4676967.1 hypothetical protein J4E84_009267 [Alternaria hordeiaustralica]